MPCRRYCRHMLPEVDRVGQPRAAAHGADSGAVHLSMPRTPWSRNAVTGILITAVYVLAGKAGLELALVNASATAVWAPAGIALAAVLLCGFRAWPYVFLGAFLTNATTAGTLA